MNSSCSYFNFSSSSSIMYLSSEVLLCFYSNCIINSWFLFKNNSRASSTDCTLASREFSGVACLANSYYSTRCANSRSYYSCLIFKSTDLSCTRRSSTYNSSFCPSKTLIRSSKDLNLASQSRDWSFTRSECSWMTLSALALCFLSNSRSRASLLRRRYYCCLICSLLFF